MKPERVQIGGIPALLYGAPAERGYLFLHGQMGRKEEAEAFVETFAQDHPGYELLDYAVGSPDTAPIHAAVIAKDTESGSSSTLFLLGDNGVTQQLELAQDSYTVYREEDGITLEGNVVHLSLDLSIPAAASLWEIHDYAITVTQDENGIQNTNQDTIRSE